MGDTKNPALSFLRRCVVVKEKVSMLINSAISELNLFVEDAYIKEEEGITSLNIILDSEQIIDLDLITEASRIINPIMDEADLVEGEYVLDISSKEKGENNHE